MKIYDISLTLQENMTVWAGDPQPKFPSEISKSEQGEVHLTSMVMGAHSGTHVDAPLHFVPGGHTVDELSLDLLIGPVQVVETFGVKLVTRSVLEKQMIDFSIPRLLLKTDNSTLWDDPEHSFFEKYVAVSEDGIQYLLDQGIRLVGIDYLSIAPYDAVFGTHQTFLGGGGIALEGVDLRGIVPGVYQMVCLPMKIKGSDGAPARVVLIKED